jgi:hypothetical protein
MATSHGEVAIVINEKMGGSYVDINAEWPGVRCEHRRYGLNIEKLSYGATCTARVGICHVFV